jgi:hypothetical protein
MENSKKLIQLSVNDNVLIVCQNIEAGEILNFDGKAYTIKQAIDLGHKIAARAIVKGESIIKFKVSIGSAIVAIKKGEHVHIHNIKSDFIPTYTVENHHIKTK